MWMSFTFYKKTYAYTLNFDLNLNHINVFIWPLKAWGFCPPKNFKKYLGDSGVVGRDVVKEKKQDGTSSNPAPAN